MPCCGRPLCQHFHQFHQFHQCPRWRFSTGRCPAACQAAWPLPLSRGAKGCTQNSACGAGVEGSLRKMRRIGDIWNLNVFQREKLGEGQILSNIIGKNWIWLWIWIHNPWFDSSLWSLPCFSILFARFLGQVKARFAQWMQSSSITTSPNLDILPEAAGEGRCVVCTNDLEKGAWKMQWKFGGDQKHSHKNNKPAECCSWGFHSGTHDLVFNWCF